MELNNTKIYLSNEEDRVKFLKKVFELGVRWSNGTEEIDTTLPCYAISDEKTLYHLESDVFLESDIQQVFLEDILKIDKLSANYGFKTGQPVLVRDLATWKWEYGIFGRYVHGDRYPNKCIGNSYVYCIPFEGNEHLLGKC